jgi:hypothetical protein
MTLAATLLSFTLPTLNAPGGPPLCIDLNSVQCYRTVQSQTWVAKHAVMEAVADSFTFYWPRVRAEAAPVQIQSAGVTWAQAGTRFAFTVSDSAGRSYFVTTRDLSLNESQPSNWVTK